MRLELGSFEDANYGGDFTRMMLRFNDDGHMLKDPDFNFYDLDQSGSLVGDNIYSMTDSVLKKWAYLIRPGQDLGGEYLVNFDENTLEYGEVKPNDGQISYIDGMDNSRVYTIDSTYTAY